MSQVVDALIVCTRNRPNQIQRRLEEFSKFESLPSVILIVDSSDNFRTGVVVENISTQIHAHVFCVQSKPGLPYQRNIGITWIRERFPDVNLIHFLDDDIVVNSDYFANVRAICVEQIQAVAIGGFDQFCNPLQNAGITRRLLGIGSSRDGVILRSGIAIPPHPRSRAQRCDWLVGGMQSVRVSVFDHIMFDPELRMYGEDLDFYLRVCALGDVICSINLPIKHLHDPTNRDTWRENSLYHCGVRWLLAQRYPTKISRVRVLLGCVVLAVGHFALFVQTKNPQHREACQGNLEFIYRLVRKMPVLQSVS